MANPDPIQQDIKVNADTQGVDDVKRAMDGLEKQTDDTSKATEKAGRAERTRDQKLAGMKDKLETLTRAQIRYEDATDQGARATDKERAAAARRERQIQRLSGALRDQQRVQDRMNDSIRGTTQDTDNATGAVGALGRSLTGLVGGVTAIAAVRGGVRLLVNELEQAKQLAADVFDTQVTIASADRSLKENLFTASDEEVAKAQAAARQIAEDNSIPIAQATEALASALSARGGNLDEAIEFVNLAAQVRPDRPKSLGQIAGAVGDVSNAIDAESPLEALGFLQTVGAQSRVPNSQQQAESIPAAITGIAANGFSPQEAGALFAALSVGTADTTGKSTQTASISLASQINTFFQSQGRTETGSGAIAALQEDLKLREVFLENFSLEERAKAPALALISNESSPVSQRFDANREQFGDPGLLVTNAQRQIKRLNSGPLEETAQINRVLDSLGDQLNADNLDLGRVGAIRDKLSDVLRSSGSSAIDQRLDELVFDADNFASPQDALDDMIDILRERRDQLKGRDKAVFNRKGEELTNRRGNTETELNAIATIDRAIEKLELIIDSAPSPPSSPASLPTTDIQLPDDLQPAIDGATSGAASGAGGGRSIINYGTIYSGAGDALIDDLDGSGRV